MRRREFIETTSAGVVAGTLHAGSARGQVEEAAAWRFDTGSPVTTPVVAVGETLYAGTEDGVVYALDAAEGTERWRFEHEEEREYRGPPTVAEGSVYLACGGVELCALDAADGAERWRYGTRGSIARSPTVAGDRVYAGSFDSSLHAVATATGDRLWEFATGGSLTFSPVVTDGTVYAGSGDGNLYAVDAAEGTESWRFAADTAPYAPPAVVDGTVYLGSSNTNLYALDAATGTEQWRFEAGRSFQSQPTVANGTVYLGRADRNLYAVDAATGDQRWFVESGQVLEAPVVADGTLYFGTTGDRGLYAVDAAAGEVRWRHDLDYRPAAAPTVTDGTVYLATTTGDLLAVAATDGTERWRYRAGGLPSAAPKVVDDTVYLGTADNAVHAVDAAAARSLAGSPTSTATDAESSLVLPGWTGEAAIGGAVATFGGLVYAAVRHVRRVSGADEEPSGETPDGATEVPSGEKPDGASGGSETDYGTDVAADADVGPEESSRGTDTDGVGPESPSTDRSTASRDTLAASDDQSAPRDRSAIGAPGDGVPASVPRAPDLSLSYDDIERGDRIGTGGNADVYEAVVPSPDGERRVALKQPRFEGTLHAETVERFAREAETWATLDDHDNVVGVVDWGTEPLPWLALEYMDAGDLGAVAGDLPLDRALWAARGVVEGVRHAHTRGVAHLDLKPANVLFREADGWPVPKVADWGLARLMLESSRSVEGLSPAYAAPEQFAEDRGEVGQATDIYQLGAVLYELFTGQPPYEGPPVRVMNEVLSGPSPDPLETTPALPDAVGRIVTRAMATDQGDRYEDVLYLRDDLVDLAGDP